MLAYGRKLGEDSVFGALTKNDLFFSPSLSLRVCPSSPCPSVADRMLSIGRKAKKETDRYSLGFRQRRRLAPPQSFYSLKLKFLFFILLFYFFLYGSTLTYI